MISCLTVRSAHLLQAFATKPIQNLENTHACTHASTRPAARQRISARCAFQDPPFSLKLIHNFLPYTLLPSSFLANGPQFPASRCDYSSHDTIAHCDKGYHLTHIRYYASKCATTDDDIAIRYPPHLNQPARYNRPTFLISQLA